MTVLKRTELRLDLKGAEFRRRAACRGFKCVAVMWECFSTRQDFVKIRRVKVIGRQVGAKVLILLERDDGDKCPSCCLRAISLINHPRKSCVTPAAAWWGRGGFKSRCYIYIYKDSNPVGDTGMKFEAQISGNLTHPSRWAPVWSFFSLRVAKAMWVLRVGTKAGSDWWYKQPLQAAEEDEEEANVSF